MGKLLNIFDHYKWTEEEVAEAWEHAWDEVERIRDGGNIIIKWREEGE